MAKPKFHSVSDPAPLQDLIPGLAPKHHITVLSGDSYVGKTRLALRMAEAFVKGIGFFWDPLPPMKVGYFSERSAASVVRQANDQDIDLSEVTFITLLDLPKSEEEMYMTQSLQWLDKVLSQYSFDIIFLDTFGHFLPAYARSKGALNDYGLMTKATIELQRLCMRHKVTPICLYHNAKEKVGSEFKSFKAKVSGSAAITANTLAVWSLSEYEGPMDAEEEEEVKYRQLDIAYHHGPDQVLYFRTLPNGSFLKIDRLEADTPAATKSSTRESEVLSMIPDSGITRKELVDKIQENLGLGRTRTQNIVKKLLDSRNLFTTQSDSGEIIKIRKVALV